MAEEKGERSRRELEFRLVPFLETVIPLSYANMPISDHGSNVEDEELDIDYSEIEERYVASLLPLEGKRKQEGRS
jgi:hypothetical protein